MSDRPNQTNDGKSLNMMDNGSNLSYQPLIREELPRVPLPSPFGNFANNPRGSNALFDAWSNYLSLEDIQQYRSMINFHYNFFNEPNRSTTNRDSIFNPGLNYPEYTQTNGFATHANSLNHLTHWDNRLGLDFTPNYLRPHSTFNEWTAINELRNAWPICELDDYIKLNDMPIKPQMRQTVEFSKNTVNVPACLQGAYLNANGSLNVKRTLNAYGSYTGRSGQRNGDGDVGAKSVDNGHFVRGNGGHRLGDGDGKDNGSSLADFQPTATLIPDHAQTILQSEHAYIEMLVNACAKGEDIATKYQNVPCFKNIKKLCEKTRNDLLTQHCTARNIHSQGVPWATKDYIFAFTRLTSCWYLLKGYLGQPSDSFARIESLYSPGLHQAFDLWEKSSQLLSYHMIKSFVALANHNNRWRPDSTPSNDWLYDHTRPQMSDVARESIQRDLTKCGFFNKGFKSDVTDVTNDADKLYLSPGCYTPPESNKEPEKRKQYSDIARSFASCFSMPSQIFGKTEPAEHDASENVAKISADITSDNWKAEFDAKEPSKLWDCDDSYWDGNNSSQSRREGRLNTNDLSCDALSFNDKCGKDESNNRRRKSDKDERNDDVSENYSVSLKMQKSLANRSKEDGENWRKNSRSGDLSSFARKNMEAIIGELWNVKDGHYFAFEIDTRSIPEYYKIVERPMFLSVILKNLKSNKYSDLTEIVEDVRRIVANHRKFIQECPYNRQLTEHMIKQFSDKFESLLKKNFPRTAF